MVDIFPKPNKKVITIKEAIKDLINSKEDLKETDITKFAIYNELKKLKPGEKSNKYISLLKQKPNRPSAVITKTSGCLSAACNCHWDNRKFTVNEIKRIFSFPNNFNFRGGYNDQVSRLGNCVPPKFMEAIAKQIIVYLKDIRVDQKEYTVISTFAGCGGSSLGYKWAGFKELLAIDFDKNSVETFTLNFPEVPVWQRDIKTVTANEILDFCKIEVGELDVLDGSPPCQGFSTAGKRIVTDERNDLFKEYVRLIDGLQPKVFIMENVSGMIKGKMKGKFIEIMKTLKNLNYEVKCKLMNAKYYNVPQSRERLIFIGVRKNLGGGIKPSFPEGNKKVITIKEAWKGLENQKGKELSNRVLQIYNNTKPGEFLEYGANRIGLKGYFTHRKLSFNRTANTINKSIGSGIYHPKEPRFISILELKRLASFPDNFNFIGSLNNQWARIGNAVMPKFMLAIAENIRVNILDKYYYGSNNEI